MKSISWTVCGMCFLGAFSHAQEDEKDVPLMRPDEEKIVNAQAASMSEVLSKTLAEASKSTVRVWGRVGRQGKPAVLAYGTVVGNGKQVLTKWSEVEASEKALYVQSGSGEAFEATVNGVFSDEDLVLLDLGEVGDKGNKVTSVLSPAKFVAAELVQGRFISAPQADGKLAGFGVISVLERNLRETDRAHLGVLADQSYRGKGVKIANVQPEYGAAEAGIQPGDLILEIDDREISGLQELRNSLINKMPGDVVKILVDSAGEERYLDVVLSNRPIMGQFSGDRLNQMERMGGEPNRVRNGFSRVVQTDMKIEKNQMGGPVVDLEGKIVGITMARADRTRTYLMSGPAVMAVLKESTETVAQAREKMALQRQQLAEQRRSLMPRNRPAPQAGKPFDPERAQRHLQDVERLRERIYRELELLEQLEP
jgi:membrane-associated protease RseP (regulator of RpoE activity)